MNSSGTTHVKSGALTYTIGFMAPEIFEITQEGKFNYFKCDVYSLGILFLSCCGVSRGHIEDIPKKIEKTHDNYRRY
jgi:hypothetical protein